MGKNNQEKQQQNKGNSLTDPIKTKSGKEIKGLETDVNKEVSSIISNRKTEPYETVKGKLAEKELQRRADVLMNALYTEYPKVVNMVKEIGPDLDPEYNEDDKEVKPKRYSAEAWKKKTKTLERFESLKKAIETVRKDGNYELLDKYFNQYK